MQRGYRPILLLLFALAAWPASAPATDYVIEESVHASAAMGQPAKDTVQVIYWSGNRMRSEEKGGGQVVLLRGDLRKIYMLDPSAKTWSEITFDELKARGTEAARMMAQMTGGEPAKATSKATGATREISGFPCKQHLLGLTGMLPVEMEIWATDKVDLDYASFRELSGMISSDTFLGPLVEEIRKVPGFPIETSMRVNMMGQVMETRQVVTKVVASPVPAGLFDLPAGWKRVASPLEGMEAPAAPDAPTPASPGPR